MLGTQLGVACWSGITPHELGAPIRPQLVRS